MNLICQQPVEEGFVRNNTFEGRLHGSHNEHEASCRVSSFFSSYSIFLDTFPNHNRYMTILGE